MSSISCFLLLLIIFRLFTFPSMASCSKYSLLRIFPIKLAFLLKSVQNVPVLADSSQHPSFLPIWTYK
uniref:Putative secreted protein n=1 Tax=Xenopsylla cheopis TaxID=163159 RepID=A0A6M2E375_XENCH